MIIKFGINYSINKTNTMSVNGSHFTVTFDFADTKQEVDVVHFDKYYTIEPKDPTYAVYIGGTIYTMIDEKLQYDAGHGEFEYLEAVAGAIMNHIRN